VGEDYIGDPFSLSAPLKIHHSRSIFCKQLPTKGDGFARAQERCGRTACDYQSESDQANDDAVLRRLCDHAQRRVPYTNSLHAKHGFSEEESVRITELVMNYFESVIVD
jgi:hypothetical protein